MNYIKELPEIQSVPHNMDQVILIASSSLQKGQNIYGDTIEKDNKKAVFLTRAGFFIGNNSSQNCINEMLDGPFRINSRRMMIFPQTPEELENLVQDTCNKIASSGLNQVSNMGMLRPLLPLWMRNISLPFFD